MHIKKTLLTTTLSLALLAGCAGVGAGSTESNTADETAAIDTTTDDTAESDDSATADTGSTPTTESSATDDSNPTDAMTEDDPPALDGGPPAGGPGAGGTPPTGGPGGGGTPPTGGPGGSDGPGGVDVSSVSTEAELIALIQEAYGDGSLDLHRGHQPVQDVLNEVLTISHEELHVYMEEQRMNLAAVATEIGVDPQTLIDALVEAWSPAIDNALATGSITETEAAEYLADLEEAFVFRVTWDGVTAEPTYTGLS